MIIQILAPFLAGIFYGGWAAYSNIEYGNETALMAFIVQGGFAFTSTLLLTHFVSWSIRRQKPRVNQLVVFAQSLVILVATPAILHLIAGTPDIIQAMLPGIIIGNIYVWFLIKRLS